jgi:hypothetical protein
VARCFASLVFILLLVVSCKGNLTRVKVPLPTANLQKTVYIDNSFEPWQEDVIINALRAWECSTNNLVKFHIHLHLTEKQSASITMGENPLIIAKVNSNDPRIVSIQKDKEDEQKKNRETHRVVVGLYMQTSDGIPLILLVDDMLKTPIRYSAVATHEIGHNWLGHNIDHNSAMYKHMDEASPNITENDLIALCDLYWCDAEKMSACK